SKAVTEDVSVPRWGTSETCEAVQKGLPFLLQATEGEPVPPVTLAVRLMLVPARMPPAGAPVIITESGDCANRGEEKSANSRKISERVNALSANLDGACA